MMTILRNVLVILAIAASAEAMSSTVLPGYKTQFRVVKKGDSERFDRCILEIVINLVVDGRCQFLDAKHRLNLCFVCSVRYVEQDRCAGRSRDRACYGHSQGDCKKVLVKPFSQSLRRSLCLEKQM